MGATEREYYACLIGQCTAITADSEGRHQPGSGCCDPNERWLSVALVLSRFRVLTSIVIGVSLISSSGDKLWTLAVLKLVGTLYVHVLATWYVASKYFDPGLHVFFLLVRGSISMSRGDGPANMPLKRKRDTQDDGNRCSDHSSQRHFALGSDVDDSHEVSSGMSSLLDLVQHQHRSARLRVY